jgi:hypothetical protein
MAPLLPVLWLVASCGDPNPSDLAADRLRDMLQRAHEERDGARLVARKLSVESALLPAFIVQDLAHGCASQDVARSLSYTYGGPDDRRLGSLSGILDSFGPRAPMEPGWDCPPGMAWRVRATTERTCSAGPEPAVAIDWVIESDGRSTTAIAERFEPALMPAELDFPLLPWGLVLRWDGAGGHALDRSGQSHAESWVATAPVLANPDDMFDTFDALRVQQWLSRWRPAGRTELALLGPCVQTIELDHGPLRWHDPSAFTLTRHGSRRDRSERFRPVRLLPNVPGLRAIIEWRSCPADPPSRVPSRVRLISNEGEQAIITFGRFELVPQGSTVDHPIPEPPWSAVRQALAARDHITLTALVLHAQDGLGMVQARARMGIELAIQALDAAIEEGWTLEHLRRMAPELLDRCLSRLTPPELTRLTLDATVASRGTLAVLAATRLLQHGAASAEERAWATMALPSLWAWLHEPPADDSPLAARRLACDRALRPIMLGEPSGLALGSGGSS